MDTGYEKRIKIFKINKCLLLNTLAKPFKERNTVFMTFRQALENQWDYKIPLRLQP